MTIKCSGIDFSNKQLQKDVNWVVKFPLLSLSFSFPAITNNQYSIFMCSTLSVYAYAVRAYHSSCSGLWLLYRTTFSLFTLFFLFLFLLNSPYINSQLLIFSSSLLNIYVISIFVDNGNAVVKVLMSSISVLFCLCS